MKREENIEKLVEDTLNSLEGLGKVEVNPFFYRKLEAKMLGSSTAISHSFALVGNLRLNVALLLCFLIFNVFTFISLNEKNELETASREDQIELLANDYFSGGDDYEYLNNY